MGTRHLVAVQYQDEYKVAQYGQYDGYPEAAGANVLSFLKTANLTDFKDQLDSVSFYTEDELDDIFEKYTDNGVLIYGTEKFHFWGKNFKNLSRNTGSDILHLIYNGKVKKLGNNIKFAENSLFCEWAYVINLDENVLEVYKGFNKTGKKSPRFPVGGNEFDYGPVLLKESWDINKLPTEADFILALSPPQEDE